MLGSTSPRPGGRWPSPARPSRWWWWRRTSWGTACATASTPRSAGGSERPRRRRPGSFGGPMPGGCYTDARGAPMRTAGNVVVALVALLHLYFLVLEMFLWEGPVGRRVFGLTPEFAKASRVLAANQGLYNGFLVAGLAWGLALGAGGTSIKVFFLACVVAAGIFGGLTASRRILWVQALPGAVGLALVLAS